MFPGMVCNNQRYCPEMNPIFLCEFTLKNPAVFVAPSDFQDILLTEFALSDLFALSWFT